MLPPSPPPPFPPPHVVLEVYDSADSESVLNVYHEVPYNIQLSGNHTLNPDDIVRFLPIEDDGCTGAAAAATVAPLSGGPLSSSLEVQIALPNGIDTEFKTYGLCLADHDSYLPAVPPGCSAWRQTSGCVASGPREPHFDKGCYATIDGGASGYCECTGGSTVGFGCGHSVLRCSSVCARLAPSSSDPVTDNDFTWLPYVKVVVGHQPPSSPPPSAPPSSPPSPPPPPAPPPPSLPPPPPCTDRATPWLIKEGLTCKTATFPMADREMLCKGTHPARGPSHDHNWPKYGFCEQSCWDAGFAFNGSSCGA